jgi:hypothetical protein
MFYYKESVPVEEVRCEPAEAGPARPAVYVCSLPEVRQLVCSSPGREKMWLRLESFLARTNPGPSFSHLNLIGPFVSSRDHPREIDAVLQTRAFYGAAAFAALQPFFTLGLDEIRERYGIRLRFWIEGAPLGLRFIRGHGTVGAPSSMPGLHELMRQGIVRVELDA